MKVLSMLLMLLMLLVGCSSTTGQAAEGKDGEGQQAEEMQEVEGDIRAIVAKLLQTEGNVSVIDDVLEKLDIIPDMRLYGGYNVNTEDSSYAWMNLDDSKLLKEDQNSSVVVDKTDNNIVVSVDKGALFFNVTQPLGEDENLDFKLGNVSVGVRGTAGWIKNNTDASKDVYILEGKVETNTDTDSYSVGKGFVAHIPDSESTDSQVELRPFSSSEIDSFVQQEIESNEELKNRLATYRYLRPFEESVVYTSDPNDPIALSDRMLDMETEAIHYYRNGNQHELSLEGWNAPITKNLYYHNIDINMVFGSNFNLILDSCTIKSHVDIQGGWVYLINTPADNVRSDVAVFS